MKELDGDRVALIKGCIADLAKRTQLDDLIADELREVLLQLGADRFSLNESPIDAQTVLRRLRPREDAVEARLAWTQGRREGLGPDVRPTEAPDDLQLQRVRAGVRRRHRCTGQVRRNIDVVWKEEFRINAAFKVENSTAIYSGLLRFADLNVVAPNSLYPMFIVAPAERRNRVREQLLRPVFKRLDLREKVRFLPYETIDDIDKFVQSSSSGLSVDLMQGRAEVLVYSAVGELRAAGRALNNRGWRAARVVLANVDL
jgi:hypothetical protein